ncbi:N-acetyltransferase family protein [Halobacterium hubeiense]|uniref:GNAT family N-acetyltransferase n=1 Tax=Halobacterium hubeiense TaxID=1407499 RepID=UPI003C730A96
MSSPPEGVVQRVAGLARRLVARLRPERISLTPPPLTFTDGEDREVVVRAAEDDDFESLVAMYDDFDPAQRAQGTPPLGEDAIRDWLDDVLDGPNVVALVDGDVVGHVMFVPDGTGRHELAIFVHQDYQRAGVGTHLLAAGLEHARQEGVEYVWLSVESWKRGAQRLYQRAGFSTVNPMGAAHRMSRYL